LTDIQDFINRQIDLLDSKYIIYKKFMFLINNNYDKKKALFNIYIFYIECSGEIPSNELQQKLIQIHMYLPSIANTHYLRYSIN